MNITEEKISHLNTLLKVAISPEDYAQQVDAQLKTLQKKVNVPGFRPGKVPVGMVKKMYGKSVLADEINKMLNNSVNNYITEQKLDILGQPIPADEHNSDIDWDNNKNFEFTFELGLAPEFTVEIESEPFEYQLVKVDDSLIDKEIEDMQRRYGKMTNPEKAEKGDLVFGEFTELDAEGNEQEGGIKKSSSIATDKITDTKTLDLLLAASRETEVTLDPHLVSGGAVELASMLGVNKEKAEEISTNFKFKVINISRNEKAELNQELFHKIYGETINTEEEFRAKIKEELSSMFNADSDKVFMNKVITGLQKKYDPELPEAFLKRWLKFVSEKEVSTEQLDNEFPSYASRLKTQMVINKMIKQHGISLSNDEIIDYVKDLIRKQYASYNPGIEMEDKDLDDTVNRVLKNEKEYNRIAERLYDGKLLELLKSKLKLNFTEVSFDQFYHQH